MVQFYDEFFTPWIQDVVGKVSTKDGTSSAGLTRVQRNGIIRFHMTNTYSSAFRISFLVSYTDCTQNKTTKKIFFPLPLKFRVPFLHEFMERVAKYRLQLKAQHGYHYKDLVTLFENNILPLQYFLVPLIFFMFPTGQKIHTVC
jgi:hypothetical protein